MKDDNKNKKATESQEKLIFAHMLNGGIIDLDDAAKPKFKHTGRLASRISAIKKRFDLEIKKGWRKTKLQRKIRTYWLEFPEREAKKAEEKG